MQAKVMRANLIRHVRENHLFKANDHVIVALSGGADSLHLVTWLTDGNLPADLQPQVSVVYVNHQLRDDAQDEEQLVRNWLTDHAQQLEHSAVVTIEWDNKPTTGVEEVAREKRYSILYEKAHEWNATKILTAHHQDDQVETIFFKLIRGGQISQLKGMQERQLRDGIELVRPFLTLPKADLPFLVDQPITEFIEDSTNLDESYARNKIRQTILPELRELNAGFDQHILAEIAQFSALETIAQPLIDQAVSTIETGEFDWKQPEEQIVLYLQAWLAKAQLYSFKQRQLRQVIQLMRNQSVNAGEVKLNDEIKIVRRGKQILLKK